MRGRVIRCMIYPIVGANRDETGRRVTITVYHCSLYTVQCTCVLHRVYTARVRHRLHGEDAPTFEPEDPHTARPTVLILMTTFHTDDDLPSPGRARHVDDLWLCGGTPGSAAHIYLRGTVCRDAIGMPGSARNGIFSFLIR